MHALPFTFKRIHHRLLAFARPFAKFFNITPARYDLLERVGYGIFQAELPFYLGVTRATISRMVIALERLGLISRRLAVDCDRSRRRLKKIELTRAGQRVVDSVRYSMIQPWFQTMFEEHFRLRLKSRARAEGYVRKLSWTLRGLASGLLDQSMGPYDAPPLIKTLRVHWSGIEQPMRPDEVTRTYSLSRRVVWPPAAWPPNGAIAA